MDHPAKELLSIFYSLVTWVGYMFWNKFVCQQLYAALTPFRNLYLDASSYDPYKETYDTLEYPDKEWWDFLPVK